MHNTPDEIKRNIVTCMELNMEKFVPGATQKALGDALALIQQIEAQNAELSGKIGQLEAENKNLRKKIRRMQTDRNNDCGHAGPGIRSNY